VQRNVRMEENAYKRTPVNVQRAIMDYAVNSVSIFFNGH
jgi:hypothetical protein